MTKSEAISLLDSVESEFARDMINERNFHYHNHIVFGLRVNLKDQYKVHFGVFTRSNRPIKRIQRILDENEISKADVIIKRVFQKNNSPMFLTELGGDIGAMVRKMGTLGLYVQDAQNDNGFITCGHVLPYKEPHQNSVVYSPSRKSYWFNRRKSISIASVRETYPPNRNDINEIDAAFAVTSGEEIKLSNIIGIGHFKGRKLSVWPKGKEVPMMSTVYKLGCSSLIRWGVYAEFTKEFFIQRHRFRDFIIIDEVEGYLAFKGDSGGPAFIEMNGNLYCIGIVVGAYVVQIDQTRRGQVKVAVCPIHRILDKMNLKPI